MEEEVVIMKALDLQLNLYLLSKTNGRKDFFIYGLSTIN